MGVRAPDSWDDQYSGSFDLVSPTVAPYPPSTRWYSFTAGRDKDRRTCRLQFNAAQRHALATVKWSSKNSPSLRRSCAMGFGPRPRPRNPVRQPRECGASFLSGLTPTAATSIKSRSGPRTQTHPAASVMASTSLRTDRVAVGGPIYESLSSLAFRTYLRLCDEPDRGRRRSAKDIDRHTAGARAAAEGDHQ
jgi:hypothetical protein